MRRVEAAVLRQMATIPAGRTQAVDAIAREMEARGDSFPLLRLRLALLARRGLVRRGYPVRSIITSYDGTPTYGPVGPSPVERARSGYARLLEMYGSRLYAPESQAAAAMAVASHLMSRGLHADLAITIPGLCDDENWENALRDVAIKDLPVHSAAVDLGKDGLVGVHGELYPADMIPAEPWLGERPPRLLRTLPVQSPSLAGALRSGMAFSVPTGEMIAALGS